MSNHNVLKQLARGYDEYQKSLYLSVSPLSSDGRVEYGEASSDDLSSDWDTESEDVPKQCPKVCHSLHSFTHSYLLYNFFMCLLSLDLHATHALIIEYE